MFSCARHWLVVGKLNKGNGNEFRCQNLGRASQLPYEWDMTCAPATSPPVAPVLPDSLAVAFLTSLPHPLRLNSQQIPPVLQQKRSWT